MVRGKAEGEGGDDRRKRLKKEVKSPG